MIKHVILFLLVGALSACSPEFESKVGKVFEGTGNLVKGAGQEVSNNWDTNGRGSSDPIRVSEEGANTSTSEEGKKAHPAKDRY